MTTRPGRENGVRRFSWCETGQHDICRVSYQWNGETVLCGCPCHKETHA